MAPNVAVRLNRLSTSALAGTTTLPKSMNSTTKVTTTMIPPASGMRPKAADLLSTRAAVRPPTSTAKGRGRSRIVCTTSSPWVEKGSTDGTTLK